MFWKRGTIDSPESFVQRFGEKSMKEAAMNDDDRYGDSRLWHACAGEMVQMPAVNSRVYYFPQGHAEHADGAVDFGSLCRLPPLILCRVTAVKFMADRATDEVFAAIQMVPIRDSEPDYGEDDRPGLGVNGKDGREKPSCFAKALTRSDANNGGGFSVPRYCADTLFPKLDYSLSTPAQTLIAKDVHGEVWRFRHIYRGTPRRHLLTTGWSNFVNRKKLVSGNLIVFVKADNGDLRIGIRRTRKNADDESPSGLTPPGGIGVSICSGSPAYWREGDRKLKRGSGGNFASTGDMRGRTRIRAESVVEAATLAANGQPFEVVYYPGAGTPEFCVKAASVKAAMRIHWYPGMRFKMAFETEDSSRISWFMGTISSVNAADPMRWSSSPWRLLQVAWDEPDLLLNVKRVNPWLVELVSHMPGIDLVHLPPPNKRPRTPQQLDMRFEGQFPAPGALLRPCTTTGTPFRCLIDSAPAGIQGARHAKFGPTFSSLHLSRLQFHAGGGVGNGNNQSIDSNISCLLTIGRPSVSQKESTKGEAPQLVLFGQRISAERPASLRKHESECCKDASQRDTPHANVED